MEILINELSLHGQFKDTEEFIATSFNNFMRLYSFLENYNIHPLKNYNFYHVNITPNQTFHDLLTTKNTNRISDEVRQFKKLAEKCISEPYWESNRQHDLFDNFTWNNQNITGTALAESYIRSASLISFDPSKFATNEIEIKKNNEPKNILNFYNSISIALFLFQQNKITFYQYCIVNFKNSKLDFSKVNQEKSFNLITDKNDENEFLNSFTLFTDMDWKEILAQGGKGKNKVGLAFEKYHDQNYFDKYNIPSDIYKFRCSQKYRAFGYRVGDVFHILEFDLKHRLSD